MQEETLESGGSGGRGGSRSHLWWAGASAGQLGWAVVSSRRGCAGNSTTMPFKAFAVASLYVGSIATAGVAGLQASGIRKVSSHLSLSLCLRFLGVYQSFWEMFSLWVKHCNLLQVVSVWHVSVYLFLCNYNYVPLIGWYLQIYTPLSCFSYLSVFLSLAFANIQNFICQILILIICNEAKCFWIAVLLNNRSVRVSSFWTLKWRIILIA